MKPESVLNLKSGEDLKAKLEEWIKEYKAFATEFINTEELANMLTKRAEKAPIFYRPLSFDGGYQYRIELSSGGNNE